VEQKLGKEQILGENPENNAQAVLEASTFMRDLPSIEFLHFFRF
jgi:hypothetical protein